uniref:Uncharacterized protein n=1 Tax=Cucumis sativus TaxID=3659 RepID=A0A0A0LHI4_CUCSA
MASLLLLLSQLLRHHDTNPDYSLTLPSPPTTMPSSSSSSSAHGNSVLPRSDCCYANNYKTRICADENVMDEFLKESRVCVDLIWP